MNDLLTRFEAACIPAHARVTADRGDVELGDVDTAAIAPCPGCGAAVRRMGGVPIAGSGLDLTPSGPWWCATCIQTRCVDAHVSAQRAADLRSQQVGL